MVKGTNCDVDSVTSLLHEFIPNLSVDQNIGSELSYLLSEDHSSLFEAMLSKLEENKNKLGLLSYGVSLTTMEEVFMKYVDILLQYNDMVKRPCPCHKGIQVE